MAGSCLFSKTKVFACQTRRCIPHGWAADLAYLEYLVKLNVILKSEYERRPKGRCHIMVPAGGANAEGWLAFRDVLARIEAYTSRAAPAQVMPSIEA